MNCDHAAFVCLGMREHASPALRAGIESSLNLLTICALHNAQRAAARGDHGAVADRATAALSLNAWSRFMRNRPERLAPFTADCIPARCPRP